MQQIVLVFLGAGIGGVARFSLGKFISEILGKNFPWGTLTINLLGSFIMGFLFVVINQKLTNLAPQLSALILVGVLGGFTTFSSFSIETLRLIQQGNLLYASGNIILSTVGGLLLVALGYNLGQKLI
ncbi:MAG: fluoride efflux transporter CrcB [Pseudomonadota bacterium]|jgi:CrcB protein